tara:strand:- start:124994 stop:125413 length:420 start_codon:yes stop_codon:yes gene_type:complete
MKKKLIFSIADAKYPVSASVQHEIMGRVCKDNGFDIGFYGAEDPELQHLNPWLNLKMRNLDKKYGGFCFFSLYQLMHDDDILFKLRAVLRSNLVIAFAVEKMLFTSEESLLKNWLFLSSQFQALRNRDFDFRHKKQHQV